MIRRAILATAVFGLSVSAMAHPTRTLLVRERKLPEAGGTELGVTAAVQEADFADISVVEPYVRYGVADHFSVHLGVPFVQVDPDWGSKQSGIGDVRIGAELLVFEDIFRYPWILPYADVFLPTGDDDKGLGAGALGTSLGIAIGTQMYDHIGFVLDGRYDAIDGGDGAGSIGGAVIWDLSKQFSLQAEVRAYEKGNGEDSRVGFLGGMIYWPTERWMVGAYAGRHTNGSTGNLGALKVTYLFPRDFGVR